ncbi:Vacuolar protein sorting-associated protein 17 [Rhizophlyctis rosea]|uniref:Vacuolar protein sorting-associated protein 17 n=1 Tax=Rhizophlyctis rosea TaxID=64517 RepID=A0AAD5X370_9FUNG|nr:Vacuolar protein sorting-associated protein 17 [Rhizophlyctis rosea]
MSTNPEETDEYLKIQVQNIERSNIGDIKFNLLISTNLPTYRKQRYTITRDYSELDNLYQYFDKTFPEQLPPPPPPKSNDERFLVNATQTFFDRLLEKRILVRSEGLRSFVESEFAFLPPSPTNSKNKGFMKSLRSSSSVKEVDAFFDTARTETTGFEAGMIAFGRGNDKIAKLERGNFAFGVYRNYNMLSLFGKREEIGKASGEVAAALAVLTLDDKASLNGPIKRLSKVFSGAEDLHNRQAAYLSGAFNDECSMHIKGALGVEGALTYRSELLADYDQACKTTAKKLQVMQKLKASSSIQAHKVDAAMHDLEETKQIETETHETLKRVTEDLRGSYKEYRETREEDLRGYLEGFVRRQVEFGKAQVRVWSSLSLDGV